MFVPCVLVARAAVTQKHRVPQTTGVPCPQSLEAEPQIKVLAELGSVEASAPGMCTVAFPRNPVAFPGARERAPGSLALTGISMLSH